jgi:uncharacterized protein (DUF3084 family)
MFTFGIRIILILLLIGGSVALIGDYLGRIIGRRRLSIFHLRPRYTAIVITVITGILIAFTTIGALLIVSQDTRTALFGLEELRRGVREKEIELSKRIEEKNVIEQELTKKIEEKEKIDLALTSTKEALAKAKESIDKSKQEISILRSTKRDLEKEIKSLEKEIEISRKGKVLFKVGETLLITVIRAGPEKEKLETGLKQILSAADAYVRSLGVKSDKHLIFIRPQDFNLAVTDLQKQSGEIIVKVEATRNTVWGEEVPVRFALEKNRRIYKSGTVIAETLIDPTLSIPEIEQEIKNLLTKTHRAAKEAGVIPDPSGTVGSIPYSEIFNLAKKIKSNKRAVQLKTLAKSNVYVTGPLEIKFKVYYK